MDRKLRLRKAPEELRDYVAFDFVIINDQIDRAGAQLASIIYAERARLARQEPYLKRVVEAFTSDGKGAN